MRSFKTLLVVVLGSVLLLSLSTQLRIALAQEGTSQTFVIQAGIGTEVGNYRAFAPTTVQVHPGDTVRWIKSYCNIHFAEAESPVTEAFISTVQSGDSFSGGEANSGLSFPPPPYFELRIDAPPGTYTYYCDTYPGTVGTVEVVDASTDIPNPAEVFTAGSGEIAAALGAFIRPLQEAMDAPAQTTDNGVIVTVGLTSERMQALNFFPNAVVIQVGQSVTWVVPETSIPVVGLGFASLPIGNSRFEMAQNPQSEPTADGAEVNLTSPTWGNAMMNPGDSMTLTFTEPGVYRYLQTAAGFISGYVVVQAADAP